MINIVTHIFLFFVCYVQCARFELKRTHLTLRDQTKIHSWKPHFRHWFFLFSCLPFNFVYPFFLLSDFLCALVHCLIILFTLQCARYGRQLSMLARCFFCRAMPNTYLLSTRVCNQKLVAFHFHAHELNNQMAYLLRVRQCCRFYWLRVSCFLFAREKRRMNIHRRVAWLCDDAKLVGTACDVEFSMRIVRVNS